MVSKSMVLDVILEALDEYEIEDSEEVAFHVTEQLSDVIDMVDDLDDNGSFIDAD